MQHPFQDLIRRVVLDLAPRSRFSGLQGSLLPNLATNRTFDSEFFGVPAPLHVP